MNTPNSSKLKPIQLGHDVILLNLEKIGNISIEDRFFVEVEAKTQLNKHLQKQVEYSRCIAYLLLFLQQHRVIWIKNVICNSVEKKDA